MALATNPRDTNSSFCPASPVGCLGNRSSAFDVTGMVATATGPDCLSLREVTIAMETDWVEREPWCFGGVGREVDGAGPAPWQLQRGGRNQLPKCSRITCLAAQPWCGTGSLALLPFAVTLDYTDDPWVREQGMGVRYGNAVKQQEERQCQRGMEDQRTPEYQRSIMVPDMVEYARVTRGTKASEQYCGVRGVPEALEYQRGTRETRVTMILEIILGLLEL
ncbi:peptide deformylase, mitochondrial [Platysternon megacephalum]|uniref:Peptide deformylase, mitochondrial n=1 Tax=Platysternon megacephalum TaxID=55544 RepID=A0A4D9EB02_9SAUR|nr:peptide deformylase, mitochondrial [Platysternon megacephalum]